MSATSDACVLLIEDEIMVAGMLQGMLSSLGYGIAGTTADMETGTVIIDRERVDAVVLDINLDGEMSYSFADKLAARGIPFVFSTGYDQQSLPAHHAHRPLLKKPFRRAALGDALVALLGSGARAAVQPSGRAQEPEREGDVRALCPG